MHDSYIVKYTVDIKEKMLVIQIYNAIKESGKECLFFDVLTHSFKCILDYNQIFGIEEYEITNFIEDNKIELQQMEGYCWPIDYQTEQELESFLIVNGYKYIKINSSYGMFGWILAKSYQINDLIIDKA